MNDDEIRQWKEIVRRCNEFTDGADIDEAACFQRAMEEKYGEPFATLKGAQ